ncbi:hypothetical protein DB30_02307 [Enhygromyxa salina]|uniref:Uncharacterized protein n=1 Tax=Enhygromyxa salina TaxID=215803 RepID=A0A0C1ZM10_9BACT|nr:hypothetical protein [Enhygromyxa salina]KIG11903.1 hypothetical protein DB30_02307 [Enhygromyxa salina]
MKDQLTLRVGTPGSTPIRIESARLIDVERRNPTIEFAALNDFDVGVNFTAVAPGPYRLTMKIAGHPTLHFSTLITGDANRSFEFEQPTPKCVTITTQQASAGASVSRRVHVVSFALPSKHEAVVLLSGADLKGGTNYKVFAETWRDDLYDGLTDLGDRRNLPIKRVIHDHTVVSIFDFRTGFLEEQIKGTTGWHTMHRAMQGTQPPYLDDPEAPEAGQIRGDTDSVSITDVYYYISAIGRDAPGSLQELHFFSHAYSRAPVLANTYDNSDTDARDPTDKDPRIKDFLPINLARYTRLTQAFTKDPYIRSWGCNGSDMLGKIRAVARTHSPDEMVKYKGKEYSTEDVMRELRMYVFTDNYMMSWCRQLGADVWSAAPGTKSTYQHSGKRHYFRVDESLHGSVIAWYERNFGCQRDFGGTVSFRKLV